MDFWKKIQSKPKIWVPIGVLAVVIVALVIAVPVKDGLLGKNNDNTKTESNDTSKTENDDKENQDDSDAGNSNGDKSKGDSSSSGDSKSDGKSDDKSDSTQTTIEPAEPDKEIVCVDYASFSGQYVEDGRDELVENVAAILVTNKSEKFLELCTMRYIIDGKEATFIATGLPAGKSAWIMEDSKMTVDDDSEFIYQGCVKSFKDGVIASSDKVTITSDGNMLTAKNNTQNTLETVYVYYKVKHTDGNYFGGITYLVDFGTLEPGESIEKLAGHYKEGSTEIVRIGWQDS